MRVYFSAIFLFLLLFICSCKREEKKVSELDFESMMGRGTDCWHFVETKEDFDNLQRFKDVFVQARSMIQKQSALRIPKVLHFIWLGPKEFPMHSIQNVKSWIANHPDWQVKFWTDRKRPLPHPSMQMCFVQEFPFLELRFCFDNSSNYGEKSDLLRYEILYQEGGVYVDHDVVCLRKFDELNRSYDFYCGLEMPSETRLSSSVHVTNNLIATIPHHPILKRGMDWLAQNWQEIESLYPGQDKEAIINRIAHRTFSAFSQAVLDYAGKQYRDIIFPAFYFNAPTLKQALYARHEYAGTWFENETPFEKMARERLMLISKKANKILLACAILTGLNCIGFGFLIFYLHRKKQNARV